MTASLILIKYIHFLLFQVQYVCFQHMDSLQHLMSRFYFSPPFFSIPIRITLSVRHGKVSLFFLFPWLVFSISATVEFLYDLIFIMIEFYRIPQKKSSQ